MIPFPAQYLFRFDNLCPTVWADGWQRCEELIGEFRLKPILAIVPDNKDPQLQVSPPDPAFWERMRTLEAAGAMTGLHGFRHLCVSRGGSLLGLERKSEFAGVVEGKQGLWMREGLRILRSHRLNPRIWVAPCHGFDAGTLRALRAEGIFLLSDGFARVPFLQGGVIWIPQQLSRPAEKFQGIWTICIDPNTVQANQIVALRRFLADHPAQCPSVDDVLRRYQPTTLTLAERIYARFALWRRKSSRSSSPTSLRAPRRPSNSS